MKILQLIPSLSDGGAERFVVDLSNELTKRGNKVMLCCFFSLNDSASFFIKDLLSEIEVVSLNKKKGFDNSVFWKLRRVIRKFEPEVVHTHVRTLNYLLPLLFDPFRKFEVVHTVHNDAWKEVAGFKEKQNLDIGSTGEDGCRL